MEYALCGNASKKSGPEIPCKFAEDAFRKSKMSMRQFHGIEINEWPAKIASTAMLLVDHLCNQAFGQPVVRLPIEETPRIVSANALRTAWADVISPEDCNYVFGNPPFVGSSRLDKKQKKNRESVFGKRAVNSILWLVGIVLPRSFSMGTLETLLSFPLNTYAKANRSVHFGNLSSKGATTLTSPTVPLLGIPNLSTSQCLSHYHCFLTASKGDETRLGLCRSKCSRESTNFVKRLSSRRPSGFHLPKAQTPFSRSPPPPIKRGNQPGNPFHSVHKN